MRGERYSCWAVWRWVYHGDERSMGMAMEGYEGLAVFVLGGGFTIGMNGAWVLRWRAMRGSRYSTVKRTRHFTLQQEHPTVAEQRENEIK